MSELPEVETTKASLAPLLDQQVLSVEVRQSSLRWPIPADLSKLVGQCLIQLKRRSKYILAIFEQDTMLWHLGMSGSFRICEVGETLRKHDHLIIRFEDVELRYHDPRRFGCILWLDEYSQTKLIDTLGPEPLSADFNAKYLSQKGTDKVAPYDVTLGDALAVYPFGNTVGVSIITGENLWKALENGVSNWPGDGRFPQISGFKFSFDTTKAVGSRVQSVTKADGTAIAKDSKEYTVAVPDFMIYGGDGYVGFFTPSKAKLRGLLVDVFIEAVTEASSGGKAITIPALDGRITKVNP